MKLDKVIFNFASKVKCHLHEMTFDKGMVSFGKTVEIKENDKLSFEYERV